MASARLDATISRGRFPAPAPSGRRAFQSASAGGVSESEHCFSLGNPAVQHSCLGEFKQPEIAAHHLGDSTPAGHLPVRGAGLFFDWRSA